MRFIVLQNETVLPLSVCPIGDKHGPDFIVGVYDIYLNPADVILYDRV